ncbi:ferredoxin [Devosia limi DSM 17137]|uniref:2Fe-2S iron-sulfur cluster binding domain-containing protein n=1 Tax=Devosia limi DSM 17137 TaxID=1121477 RepID=A0A0F5LAG5_9HYPH|nr:2Fe-2S iron-sulfur cluster-binding protein [Devosia limi]KKB79386.1 ferredoxin [Devosia limi DSM 17137]SHF31352.1 2Fe-2S iron-sulfur cluster binding domain-containing protein [Devosia limi DSM 17137]
MTERSFLWNDQPIAFRDGESIAAALAAANVRDLGPDLLGQPARYFCGIGACQACLVSVDGVLREACLTPARAGLAITPAGARHV